MSSILPDFFIHTSAKRIQATGYEDDKSEAAMKNSDTAMLHVDFAENYTCTPQDEVQSAQWKQNQITYSPQLCGLEKTLNVKQSSVTI